MSTRRQTQRSSDLNENLALKLSEVPVNESPGVPEHVVYSFDRIRNTTFDHTFTVGSRVAHGTVSLAFYTHVDAFTLHQYLYKHSLRIFICRSQFAAVWVRFSESTIFAHSKKLNARRRQICELFIWRLLLFMFFV